MWRRWRWALVLGILLRIGAAAATDVFPTVANTWDSNFYHQTAESLANGEGYRFQGVPTALFPPAYPLFLSLGYRVAGTSEAAGQAMNLLASLWLLGAAGWLAHGLSGPRLARRAAVVMALEPSQIVMPVFLMSETLCAAALATALAALVRFAAGRRWPWLAFAVAAAVVAGMTRGHAFLVLPAAAWGLGRWRGWGRRSALAAMVALGVVGAAVIGAWMIRNADQMGRPVPIATNAGLNLLLGNNPNAFGGRADPPGGMPQTGDEVRDEDIARERAWEYVKSHPARTLAAVPVKVLRLLVPAPALTYRVELAAKWGRAPALAVMALAQLVHMLLWLGLLRLMWRMRGPAGPDERALLRVTLWVIGIWTLGHLPFLGGARYFFPVQFLLVIAAVAGVGGAAQAGRGVGNGGREPAAASPGNAGGA